MKRLLAAVALAVTFGLPVGATATTIQVTGSVTSITNDTASLTLDGSVVLGTPYVATYTFSPFLAPLGSPQDATYFPMTSFEVDLGDYLIVPGVAGGGSIRILNDSLFGDGYQANYAKAAAQAGSFGGTPDSVSGSFVFLEDPSGTALTSNALLQIPDPLKFPTAFWQLDANQSSGEDPHQLRIRGSISSITEIPGATVPEPATVSLLAFGGLVLMMRRRHIDGSQR
jgi:hypothetical protein